MVVAVAQMLLSHCKVEPVVVAGVEDILPAELLLLLAVVGTGKKAVAVVVMMGSMGGPRSRWDQDLRIRRRRRLEAVAVAVVGADSNWVLVGLLHHQQLVEEDMHHQMKDRDW